MLLSPNADFIPFAQSKRDPSLSPCRASTPLFHRTPPKSASSSLAFASPMLSPSPLRRQALPTTRLPDEDDVFQSPLRAYSLFPQRSPQGPPDSSMTLDDDDDIFLGPSPPSSYFIPPSSPAPLRTPLRTPVKDPTRDAFRLSPDRVALSVKHLTVTSALFSATSAGTKRKPTPICTTPSRSRTMTPLNITSTSGQAQGSSSAAPLFDRLAPLSAPRFANVRETPQTKAETELHLKKQAETMTMLSIRDLDHSDDESGYESDPDADHNPSRTIEKQRLLFMESVSGSAAAPTSSIKARTRTKGTIKGKSPGLEILTRKGLVNDEEVVEAISPGGHVTKRRARSRPVSDELLESVHGTPVASQDKGTVTPRINESKNASTIAFPSSRTMRARTISNSSTTSSEPGSSRRRPTAIGTTRTRTQSHTSRTLNRLQSSSSATLFFGPTIGSTTSNATKGRKQGRTSSANNNPVSPLFLLTDPHPTQRLQFPNRHSYAGSGSPSAWASRSPPATASSPAPINARKRMESDCSDEEADLFFSSGPADSSFAISLQRGCTPSPKKKQKRESLDPLPKKFRPRDSGVVLTDSDDDLDLAFDEHTNLVMAAMPRASTSVSTVASSFDDHELVTPGFAPSAASGWPTVVNLDNDHLSATTGMSRGVDAFILRTLAASGCVSTQREIEPKRVPGTPVKKVKTAHLVGGVTRPWQSAVAHKIGFKDFDDGPGGQSVGKGKGKPRKSLPAAFPGLSRPKETKPAKKERRVPRAAASASERDTDVDLDDGDSPTVRREAKYDGLGLGRPTTGLPPFARPTGEGKTGKAHWLMRRSSSGAFSTASDASSVNVTPTRLTPKEWMLPTPRVRTPGASPLKNALETASRSTSGSSTSTSTVTNSPTVDIAKLPSVASSQRARKTSLNLRTPAPALFTAINGRRPHTHAHPARQVHAQPAVRVGRLPAPTDEEEPGRLLRDFVEVDELGSGEFGRAMKVRYKDPARGNDVFAVKKSKRFEGVKHRLRLREEVDILKHLSDAAARSSDATVRLARRHANILGYIDSWEEDETLYMQTELCELGNFAHFLWEYGRAFPRLDEARVWKIIAELASGLRFIHDANVIHLDIKPANIFLTGEGRLKIGDFGMASVWPRPSPPGEPQLIPSQKPIGFEREGDKLYLAPEVLQGRYGKAADVFSLGMTVLETASNIVVPDQGEAWHRLRREDFSQVDLDVSPELWDLIKSMMRAAPALRIGIVLVDTHPVIMRARHAMERMRMLHGAIFGASPLGAVPTGFLDEILARGRRTFDDDDWEMDLAP